MFLAVLIIPFSDAVGKWLTSLYTPLQITFFRFFLQAIIIYIIAKILRKKIASFKPIYLLLSVFITLCMFLLFWGLMYLPLANNIALFFIEPLILTLLSIFILKEKVCKQLIIVLLIGFIGTLIIIRPNWMAYGMAAILPILAALFYALYLMTIRISKDIKDIISMQFWIGILSSCFILLIYLVGDIYEVKALGFESFKITTWWLLFLLAIITVASQFLISKALYYANASMLASFQYLEIISATFLGWLVFNDIPDNLTIFGSLVVISSGIYLINIKK